MSNNGPRLEQGRNDTIAEIKAACDHLQLDAEESSLFHSHGRAELDLAIVLRAAREHAAMLQRIMDQKPMLTIAEILRAGKARLLKDGWCQGDDEAIFGALPRKYCAATAIKAVGEDPALKFFKDINGLSGMGIADWNDAPERTLEEVLAAYDRAITAADLKITHAELAAMPMPQAVVAFLRAIRTFDGVGDIDGPWRAHASRLLDEAGFAPDCPTLDEKLAWERSRTKAEVFAVYDKAIAAAERAAS